MFMGVLVLMRMLVCMMMPVGVRVGLLTMQVFVLMIMFVLVAVDVPVLMVSLHGRASRGVVLVTIYTGYVLTAKNYDSFPGFRSMRPGIVNTPRFMFGASMVRADRYRYIRSRG